VGREKCWLVPTTYSDEMTAIISIQADTILAWLFETRRWNPSTA